MKTNDARIMRLGVITLVLMAVISAATFNLSKFPGFRGTTYYAEFSDASGIHKGNIVQVGGIRVGRVSDVTLDEDRVIVKFEIDDGDVDFGPDSTASIEVLNLLGEKFLDLQPSAEGQLESGGTIPLDNTEAAYDIVGVFGDLTTTTEEIDTQQLSEALNVVSETLDGSAPEIAAAFDGIARLSRSVSQRDEQIQTLFESSQQVTKVLERRSDDIVDLMRHSDLVFKELQEPQGGGAPTAGQRPGARDRAAGSGRGQRGADRPGPRGGRRAAGHARRQARRPEGDPAPARALRRDPQQHHRHRTVVRRTGHQPRLVPDRRVHPGLRGVMAMVAKVWQRIDRRIILLVVLLLAVGAVLNVAVSETETKKVTAMFPRAVSVYKGTDVRILGVNVGEVTAVTPAGNAVRVEMEYDAEYDLPKDAQAVIVTPTLVADRFVQLTPVYEGGPTMADGATIELPDTGVPVELDRIYGSLQALTRALGPNGVNKDGSLDHLLRGRQERAAGTGCGRQRDDPRAGPGRRDLR